MIDFIGGKHLAIRRIPDEQVAIRALRDGGKELRLNADEWFELLTLVSALQRAVDFTGNYDQGGEGIAGD